MGQSLSQVLTHVVFSTKGRAPSITDELRAPMHAYLAGIARSIGCECYRAGGVADHVHLALRMSRTASVAKVLETLKSNSSGWFKNQPGAYRGFSWQIGYGILSIGPAQLPALIAYIDRQEEHHRTVSFEDEYLEILKEYGVDFDPRYLWD